MSEGGVMNHNPGEMVWDLSLLPVISSEFASRGLLKPGGER